MKKSPMRQVGDIFRPKGAKDSKKEPIALNDELYPVEDAEATLISKLEDRGNKARHTSDGFRPAVEGERVPLGIATLGRAFEDDVENSGNSQVNPNQKLHLHDTARRVLMAQKAASFRHLLSGAHSIASSGHRRAQTLLSSIEEVGVIVKDQNIASDLTSDTFGLRSEGVSLKGFDALVESAQEEENPGVVFPNSEDQLSVGEGLPLLNLGRDNSLPHGYSAIHQRRQQARTSKIKHKWRTSMAHLNPNILAGRIWYLLSHSFLMLAFPLFATAWVLFYYFTNPSLEFLPGNASLSWWCNFIGRQLLLLELSRILQYIIIDYLVLSSRFFVKILGPWVTIFSLQSKGWPFVVGCWGLLDMILLHGDHPFQQHWLFFTSFKIYTVANSGSYILASDFYLRVLLCMVFAALATSFKRTLATLYFGKRNFETYKPKLEEILNDIIIISEIAELAAEADLLAVEEEGLSTERMIAANLKKRGQLSKARWSSVRFKKDKALDVSSDVESDDGTSEPITPNLSGRHLQASESSKKIHIKNLLDRWEDPLSNKQSKPPSSTVSDILTFRKALTYMDLEYPFSEAFGPASTRDELITSAQNVYKRLLNLAPGSKVLPVEVLFALADNGDGTIDKSKKKSLGTLFRADSDKEIQFLAFIQSCDTIYKKLRFFRASVGNASVIDGVLENIMDAIYGFTLGLVILSLLNVNAWPLLVSMSTLLVTFAFAVGPSAAKSIEGILLIVGRRPYDIGDRIIIADNPGGSIEGAANSWFVEDISLFTTTLRFAASNEVATLSNGSIANARITNCAKSKNAIVLLDVKLHIKVHQGQNLDRFRDALENYVLDNPNVWASIKFFRCIEIDTDNEYVIYRICMDSTQPWQVAMRILNDRAKVHMFCMKLAEELGVEYDSGAPRRVLYYGGNLVEGAKKDYKKDLLGGQNIFNTRDLSGGLHEVVNQTDDGMRAVFGQMGL